MNYRRETNPYIVVMLFPHRYVDDDTSPVYVDPFNDEDYTYSILSKPLLKKAHKAVAIPAKPVGQASGGCDEARQAQNEHPRKPLSVKLPDYCTHGCRCAN